MSKMINDKDPTTEEVLSGAATDKVRAVRLASDLTNRFELLANGTIHMGPGGSTAVDTKIARGSATELDITVGGVKVAQLTTAPTDADVGLLLYRNVGGTLLLAQVSMGASDTGGTGYKYLRIPNGP